MGLTLRQLYGGKIDRQRSGLLEEYWAWWSGHIYYNRYVETPKPVYSSLYEMIKDKVYFVLTANVDHQFRKV